jgi:Ca-activated chloride channel family protein
VTFTHPFWLLLLALVPVLAVVYALAQRRKPRFTIRFTALDMVDRVIGEAPRWRRHVPPVLALAGLSSLAIAAAGPATETLVDRPGGTVVLAVDVSPSMMAEDVRPSRMDAARAAVRRFADVAPDDLRVGLVSFAGSAQLEVPPSRDRQHLLDVVDDLDFRSETSLADALRQSAAATALPSGTIGSTGARSVILLSDGGSTVRASEEPVAAAELTADGVTVDTVAFGTQDGKVTLGGETLQVPVDPEPLRTVAEVTGGRFAAAETATELLETYAGFGDALVTEVALEDVGRFFLLGGVVLLVAAAVVSQRWFGRIL